MISWKCQLAVTQESLRESTERATIDSLRKEDERADKGLCQKKNRNWHTGPPGGAAVYGLDTFYITPVVNPMFPVLWEG